MLKRTAEKYAQKKVDEKVEKIVVNLKKKGFRIDEIARLAEVNIDFVEKTLSE